jgi:hypothetical protein
LLFVWLLLDFGLASCILYLVGLMCTSCTI